MNRGAAELDRVVDRLFGQLRDLQRYEADPEQPLIVRAEIRDRPVVRARAAVDDLEVDFVAAEDAEELRHREGREHQLALEAQQVERAASFRRIERAERLPSFGGHQIRFELRHGFSIEAAIGGVGDRAIREPAGGAEIERGQPLAHLGVGVRNQPVAGFHQMAVGVVIGPAFRVWHLTPPLRITQDRRRRAPR